MMFERKMVFVLQFATSNASMMLDAWEVEPEASGVEKFLVDLPYGRLSMKADISTDLQHNTSFSIQNSSF